VRDVVGELEYLDVAHRRRMLCRIPAKGGPRKIQAQFDS
jgi:hypothetical protein